MKQAQTRRTPKGQLILWVALITLAVVVIGLLGIDAAHNITGLSQWLRTQASALLIWRLTLYSGTVYGWYRMRRRFAYQGFTSPRHQRLLHAEVAAVSAIALLELMTFSSN
ncbi:hypothetical protein ACYZT7_10195 [Pseudomonas sp. RT4P38]